MTVVFDLDGTLTDTRHRDHLAEAEKWDEWNAACADDPPNAIMCALFGQLDWSWNRLMIWTGRSESQRQATLEWLATYLPPAVHAIKTHSMALLMRPEGDHRPAEVLKGEWLRAFEQRHGRLPDLAIDDRATQVAWWRSRGVATLDCGGNSY